MRLAEHPEDFVVDEIPLYRPTGSGDHTFVWVEKRGLSTERVARLLAGWAGVRPRDVGYAGRKDKHAVTRQWLSVPGLEPERALEFERDGLRVIEAQRHPHKLRTGQLRGNHFELVVRGLAPEQVAGAPAGLAALARTGLPNRFGAQRFGDGSSLDRARSLLEGGPTPRDRRTARFWLSALQAAVFNRVLAERPLPLDRLEDGDVAWIHPSGAAFVVEDAEREAPRVASFEISASGPIFGTRLLGPTGAPGERERRALDAFGIPSGDALRPPRGIRLRGARRPLRVRPEGAECRACEVDAVWLRFRLPPGSYATVLAEELFGTGGSPAGPRVL